MLTVNKILDAFYSVYIQQTLPLLVGKQRDCTHDEDIENLFVHLQLCFKYEKYLSLKETTYMLETIASKVDTINGNIN